MLRADLHMHSVYSDGTLTINSIPGAGTTATIWIPKEEKE